MKRIFRIAVLTLSLLLLVLLTVSWWLAPRWLPPLAQDLANSAGVKLTALEVGRPGWQGWHIDSFRLEIEGVEIVAADVDIGWLCCRQISHSLIAQIQHLKINQISKQPDTELTTPPVALTFLLNSIAQRMPFVTLAVTEFYGFSGQLAPIALQIVKDGSRLKITLQADPVKTVPASTVQHSSTAANAKANSAAKRLNALETMAVAGFYAVIEWQAPDSLILDIRQAASVVNLQGILNDRGLWQWTGNYRLRLLEAAEFIRSYFQPVAVPDLTRLDHFNAAGQLSATIPDVLGFGEWQLQVNNTLDAHLLAARTVSLSSQQTFNASGSRSLQKLTLKTFRITGFVEDELPWQPLPRTWQLFLKEPMHCRFGSLKAREFSSLGDVTDAHSNVNNDQQADSGDSENAELNGCLQKLALQFRSIPTEQAPLTVQVDSVVNLSGIMESVSFKLNALAQFALKGLPERVALRGEFIWNSDKFSLLSLSPVMMTWQSLPLSNYATLSGKLFAENVSVIMKNNELPQLTMSLRGKMGLELAQQPLSLDVQAGIKLSSQELKVAAASIAGAGLNLPFEFNWKMAKKNGWLSVKGTGKLREVINLQALLPEDSRDVIMVPGMLQANSFFHFSYIDGFKFKGRTQFHLDDWQVDIGDTNTGLTQLQGLVVQGDVQYDQAGMQLRSPLHVKLKSADVGIPLQDISLDVQGKIQSAESLSCQLVVTDVLLTTLGGKVRVLKPVPVECPLRILSVPVEISQLSLTKLVAIESDKVKATGNLAGLLPIRFADGKLLIDDGQVAAQGPGNISLADPQYWRTLAGGDESLELTMGILENFDYDALAVGVNLNSGGILSLTARLRGRNPEFQHAKYKGQVVDLNLNIENNILQLLRSATLPAEMEKRLQQAFQ